MFDGGELKVINEAIDKKGFAYGLSLGISLP